MRPLFRVGLRRVCAKSDAATLLTFLLGLCINFPALVASFLDVVIQLLKFVHRIQKIAVGKDSQLFLVLLVDGVRNKTNSTDDCRQSFEPISRVVWVGRARTDFNH